MITLEKHDFNLHRSYEQVCDVPVSCAKLSYEQLSFEQALIDVFYIDLRGLHGYYGKRKSKAKSKKAKKTK